MQRTSAKAVWVEASEWATPVDLAREVATQLLSSGHVIPVWLGVQGGDMPSDDALALGVRGGAQVTRVDAGRGRPRSSPAGLAYQQQSRTHLTFGVPDAFTW